jgi:SOS-response transcriptional repressor LexA
MRRFHAEHGFPASYRDIMKAFGIESPNGVRCHVDALIRKGHIRRVGRYLSRCFVPVVDAGCCPCCARPMEMEDDA